MAREHAAFSDAVFPAHSRRTRSAYVLATWFGCGRAPFAPGSVGSIGALPLYFALRPLGPLGLVLAAFVVTAVGVWASNVVVAREANGDPQHVVIDEVAGVLLALAAAPFTWSGVTAAVVLFRVFDIWKPGPVRIAERRLKAGWGVMMDDVVAGLMAALVIVALRFLVPGFSVAPLAAAVPQ